MKTVLKRIGLSVFLALFPSILSFFVALGTLTTAPSWLLKIVLWNVYLASFLAAVGALPYCGDCELFTLLQILFYGVIVGVIGYSGGIYLALALRAKRKKTIP
jgi:hypothetical protein